MSVDPSAHRDSQYHQSTHLIQTKRKKKKRICIYSKSAPHQKSDLYVFVIFHVVFEVCIYADPCTVDERKQRRQSFREWGDNDEKKKKNESGQN